MILFSPIGLYYCSKKPTEAKIFAAIYVVLAVYFASVMVRLLLVLAPAVSIMSGIGVSWTIQLFTKSIREYVLSWGKEDDKEQKDKQKDQPKKKKRKRRVPPEIALIGLIFIGYLVSIYILHANFAGSEAYASPSIILSHKDR